MGAEQEVSYSVYLLHLFLSTLQHSVDVSQRQSVSGASHALDAEPFWYILSRSLS